MKSIIFMFVRVSRISQSPNFIIAFPRVPNSVNVSLRIKRNSRARAHTHTHHTFCLNLYNPFKEDNVNIYTLLATNLEKIKTSQSGSEIFCCLKASGHWYSKRQIKVFLMILKKQLVMQAKTN